MNGCTHTHTKKMTDNRATVRPKKTGKETKRHERQKCRQTSQHAGQPAGGGRKGAIMKEEDDVLMVIRREY